MRGRKRHKKKRMKKTPVIFNIGDHTFYVSQWEFRTLVDYGYWK